MWTPTDQDSPFARLGGEQAVLALAEAFYDAMEAHEPVLARVHELDEHGRIVRRVRDRFGLFLIEWLGGPGGYSEAHGHPRLRMRHARVPIDENMRDAWLRAMGRAMDSRGITGEVREYLEGRFAHVANFLRNREHAPSGFARLRTVQQP